jgi:hypothetical protein
MSKSLSQHIVGLRVKLKVTEKEKKIFTSFYIFCDTPVIS